MVVIPKQASNRCNTSMNGGRKVPRSREEIEAIAENIRRELGRLDAIIDTMKRHRVSEVSAELLTVENTFVPGLRSAIHKLKGEVELQYPETVE